MNGFMVGILAMVVWLDCLCGLGLILKGCMVGLYGVGVGEKLEWDLGLP